MSVAVGNTTKEINLLGESGDTLSTFDALQQIAEYWDEMTNAQQTAIASSLAGKTRFDVFAATMNGFEDAIDASTTALNSQGSAWEENDKRAESLTAKLKGLNAEFVNLSTSGNYIRTLAGIFLDLATNILEFANDSKLLNTALIDLGVILAVTLIPKFVAFSSTMITTVGQIALATAETGSLANGLAYVGITAGTAQLALGGLVAVLTIGLTAYNLYNSAQEKARQEAISSLETLKSTTQQLSAQIATVQSETTTKAQLISINQSLNGSYDTESANLKDINDIRQESINLINEEAKAKAEQTIRETGSQFTKATEFVGADYSVSDRLDFETPAKALEFLNEKIDEYNEKISNGEKLTWAESNALSYYEDAQQRVSDKIDEAQGIIDGYNEANEILKNGIDESTESTENNSISLEDLAESYELSADAIQAYADANDISIEAAAQALSDQEDIKQALEDTADAYDEARSQLTALPDAYDTLNSAMNEYNSIGRLNADTLDNLLSLGDEYLSLLSFENGQMSINEAGMQALANSKIDDAEATAVQEAQAKLAAIANGTYNDTLVETSAASSVAVSAAQNAGVAIINSGNDAQTAAALWADAWNTISQQYTMSTTEQKQQSAQVSASLKTQITAYEGVRSSLGSYTKSTQSAAKATGSATKAVDAHTEALKAEQKALEATRDALQDQISDVEDEIDAYERAIDTINEAYDEKIKKLEDARDAELEEIELQKEEWEDYYKQQSELLDNREEELKDAYKEESQIIEDRIDLLEEAKDKEVSAIEAQIDAMKAAREERSNYWQAQIDELESANQAVEDQITLQNKLEALAEAKSTKVMVMGTDGKFHYAEDEGAVDKAQADLDQFIREQQYQEAIEALQEKADAEDAIYAHELDSLSEQIDQIEAYYDNEIDILERQAAYKKKIYEQELADIEERNKALTAFYDEQIAILDEKTLAINSKYQLQINKIQALKDKFNEMVNQYQTDQDYLNVLQLTGIDLEKANWDKRYKNLKTFVSNYTSKLKELDSLQSQLNDVLDQIKEVQAALNSIDTSGASSSGGTSGGGTSKINGYQIVDSSGHIVKQFSTKAEADAYMQKIATSYALTKGLTLSVEAYASGVSSIGSDQVALVGDNPSNQELVLGSKANGSLMNLGKGSGVVNATSTRTLAGILNALKDSSVAKGITSTVANNSNSSVNNSKNITIQHMTVQSNSPMELWSSLLQGSYANY